MAINARNSRDDQQPAELRRGRRVGRVAAGLAVLLLAELAVLSTGCNDGLVTAAESDAYGTATAAKRVVAAESARGDTYAVSLAPGAHEVVELGTAAAGDEVSVWIEMHAGTVHDIVLALLDHENRLLVRERARLSEPLRFTLPVATDGLAVGVLAESPVPIDLDLIVARQARKAAGPQQQVVYLNYAGCDGVSVCGRDPMTATALDAAMVGERYAGLTKELRAEITAVVREVYADYNLEIISSDEGPAPAGPHSTVHFGGSHDGQLGIADGVDRLNQDPSDEAIVYVEAFAAYDTMRLSVAELGRMMGNTAAHELGHLLGLYHTRDSKTLMDDARSAWDLAGASSFAPAPVAETVFPTGTEDGAWVLALTLGQRTE
jgi:hypothetical protein